jgi:hypothetical protein
VGTVVIWSLQQEQSAATIFVVSHSFAASQYRPPASEWVSDRPDWEHTESVKPTFPKCIALYTLGAFRKTAKKDYKLRHTFVCPSA